MSDDANQPLRRYPTAQHWGTGFAEVSQGRLVNITGDPADPEPSAIAEGYVQAIDDKVRLRRPLVRQGYLEEGPCSRERRGQEPFVELSWEAALDLAAGALDHVRQTWGNASIFGGSYGWASAGRFHHAQSQIHRFLNCIGGYTRSVNTYSFAAAEVVMPHIVGNLYDVIKSSTVWPVIARHSELVVMFGGAPAKNTQIAPGGIGHHRIRQLMIEARAAGVKFVNVSPLRDDAAEELESEWIAPRPNSDVALMLGLAHTLVSDGLYDRAFLDRYTVGFHRFESYLTGKSDGAPKTAEWAASLTGIAPQDIRALARRMAAKRTMICLAAGLQRAQFGEQPVWMAVTLAAMLGQIGLPGGGFGYGYGADGQIGSPIHDIGWPALPQGRNPVRSFIPVARITDMLLSPGARFDYDGKSYEYPDTRLVYWAGGNPFHHQQDLNRLALAFRKPETVIVHDHWWTATARHADIVFPIATALERNDIAMSRPDSVLVAMRKALDPVGKARTDFEVFAELADRLGAGAAFTEGRDEAAWLRNLWHRARSAASGHGHDLPDFDAFQEAGIFRLPAPSENRVLLSAFRADPEANPLSTPSGRIEIYSENVASFGYDDCPGHAVWREPDEWLGSEKSRRFPFHLISNQPKARLHSQLDSGGPSRATKIGEREPATMNSEDARALGLTDGDIICLYNDRGACLAGLKLSEGLRRGVVQLATGAWYDPAPAEAQPNPLDKHGNPNVLTRDIGTSRLAQGPTSHTTLVAISRFEGPLPSVTAFEPPEILTVQDPVSSEW
ncbi:MAG: molybdopterin-dependent oxidoreductase [Roseovarius sp.]